MDDKPEHAEMRQNIIESRTNWTAFVKTEIFTNADDFIEACDDQGKFFDIIFTDVFMPKKGAPYGTDSPEEGAIRIKKWLKQKRDSDEEYKYVQLRWISRHSHVSPFIHEHINIKDYSWLQWISHHDKETFATIDFPNAVETAIYMALAGNVDVEKPSNIIFESPAMMKVIDLVERIAPTEMTVLITGESGTGKELIARAIHERSARNKARFLAFNCGAVPQSLLESELFGHLRGSFTGAATDKKGYFRAAEGGTLFLDEIGDMSLAMQVSILRALQQGEVNPIGSSIAVPYNARIITATNRDLKEEIKAGRFRDDLFYRIQTIEIRLPSLRERPEDIEPLALHFLQKFAQEYNRGLLTISGEAMTALKSHHWEGNVRELETVMERAAVLTGFNGEVRINNLPPVLQTDKRNESHLGVLTPDELLYYNALKQNDFNILKTAESLNKTRQAVHKYINDKNGSGFIHPTLRRLYQDGVEMKKIRAEAVVKSEQKTIPPPASTVLESDF